MSSKRGLCALIALVFMLLLSCASAECTLTKVGDVQGADLVRDSNLLEVYTSEGYRLVTLEGEAFSPEAYASVEIQSGYVVAASMQEGINTWGALDAQGNQVIPFAYGDIEFLSPDWALAYTLTEATADNYDYSSWTSDAYYLVDTVDVYSMAAGACVATLPRANFKDAEAVGACLNIEDRSNGVVTCYDAAFAPLGTVDYVFDEDYAVKELTTFRENGQEGLMDAQGNVVMAPSFYMIYDFDGDYAEVSTGDLEGLIDRQGNVVVPAEYDRVQSSYYLPYDAQEGTNGYNAHGYFGVEKDGKQGFVREGGEVTVLSTLRFAGRVSIACLRDYPAEGSGGEGYYMYEDGTLRSPFLDVSDGLDSCAAPELCGWSEDAGCAAIALELAPIFIADALNVEALEALENEGITVYYAEDGALRSTAA